MGEVVELKPRAHQEFTSSLGMTVFLASWAMMFCSLFFAYGFIRSRTNVWPPAELPALPLGLPAANTVVLAASSVAFAVGLRALRRGRRRAFTLALLATLVLGCVFLALQLSVWNSVAASGLTLKTGGPYASVFYALTTFHALHVAVGLLLLLFLLVNTLQGKTNEHNHTSARLSLMYWHFVDVVWVLMFVTLYVL